VLVHLRVQLCRRFLLFQFGMIIVLVERGLLSSELQRGGVRLGVRMGVVGRQAHMFLNLKHNGQEKVVWVLVWSE